MKVELAKVVYQASPSTSERTMDQALNRSAQEVNRVESARIQTAPAAKNKVDGAYVSLNHQKISLQSATYQYRVQETKKVTDQISGVVAANQRDVVKVLSNLIAPSYSPDALGNFIDRFS